MLHKLKKLNIGESGFTLVELMVMIAIFVLLMSISLVNFNRAGQTQLLTLTAEELANQIRTAQTSALAGQETLLSDNTTKSYSYGIFIERANNQYVRFADAPNVSGLGSCSYGSVNFSSGNSDCPFDSIAVDSIVDTVKLPRHISWSSSQIDKHIVFRLPGRTAFVDGSKTSQTIIKLTNDLNECKQVRMAPVSGQVSVEDCST